MPAHSHPTTLTVPVSSGNAPVGGESPAGKVLATPTGGAIDSIYTAPGNSTGLMGGVSVALSSVAGSSQPVSNQQPYLGINFVICMFGVFPARN
jgi:microcystin-dependent protein